MAELQHSRKKSYAPEGFGWKRGGTVYIYYYITYTYGFSASSFELSSVTRLLCVK
jgi:hypothetical protein